ncbi:DUF4327 family protein [Aerosakkonemataceae cyanobacterium BLCC-F154]|uniref:DUF4327 family protein n=1 Tax=Floridaenema fluviatile BLCC-F154 TaxID=3153640 RepID=A0ABV4Y7C7_9CYAN
MIKTTYNGIATIKSEARKLVKRGILNRQQRIYTLWKYIPARDWALIERELENSDFLLRDCIGDLIGWEE